MVSFFILLLVCNHQGLADEACASDSCQEPSEEAAPDQDGEEAVMLQIMANRTVATAAASLKECDTSECGVDHEDMLGHLLADIFAKPGTSRLSCVHNKEVECCLQRSCAGCQGSSACISCHDDHRAECCDGYSREVVACEGAPQVQRPAEAPTVQTPKGMPYTIATGPCNPNLERCCKPHEHEFCPGPRHSRIPCPDCGRYWCTCPQRMR